MVVQKRELGIVPVLSSPHDVVPIVPVQGRLDGPVECYRVASKGLCRVTSVLGWAAVVIGAGEVVAGVLVFDKWRREGGWWAGLLGTLLGIVATGVTADTPIGTPLVAWLLALGLASFVTSLATLLALDGARWQETKGVEACTTSFDGVCWGFDCACSTSPDSWDKCFSPGNGDCGGIESSSPVLLASSIALLALAAVSTMLLAAGIKVKCLGGGVQVGGARAERPHPTKILNGALFLDPVLPETLTGTGPQRSKHRDRENRDRDRSWRPPRSREAEEEDCKEGEEEDRIEAGAVGAEAAKEEEGERREVLTGAEAWAVGYVERLAGGGNKRRRDELNKADRGGRAREDVENGGGGASGEGGVAQ